jgi:hypothetical protein
MEKSRGQVHVRFEENRVECQHGASIKNGRAWTRMDAPISKWVYREKDTIFTPYLEKEDGAIRIRSLEDAGWWP